MKTDLANRRLYGILDLGYVPETDIERITAALCTGGIDLLQLRAKKASPQQVEHLARRMQTVLRDYDVPLIINDHLAVAAQIGSEGVHVGQDDDAITRARQITGAACIIGKSTHSLAQAIAAQAEGADYIGFGPLYATGTKPDYTPIGLADIAEAHRQVNLPIYCIGGVNAARLDEILTAGAQRIVVVSAFLTAPDIAAEVQQLKTRLTRPR